MRFNTFIDQWITKTIGQYGKFHYGKSAPKWSVSAEGTIPCVRYGELYTRDLAKINSIKSYTTIDFEHLVFSTGKEVLVPRVGEDPMDFYKCAYLPIKNVAIGEMISIYETNQDPLFVTYYFRGKMRKKFAQKVEGGNVSNLYYNYLEPLKVSFPTLAEQQKIATFLDLLDQRIDTQSKIIEKYESLIKAISNKLFFNITNRVNLSEICSITTGKLDANQMDENGIYPFFTCGKETLKINKYAFDCEAILISGNGDIGRTKYYNGKFNAYQRTYILYNFKGSPIFIKYAIDYALPKKVKEETQISAMPYIKMGTLSELNIPYPDIHIQIEDVQILNTLQTKINVEKEILEKLKEQKKYLLSNMFI